VNSWVSGIEKCILATEFSVCFLSKLICTTSFITQQTFMSLSVAIYARKTLHTHPHWYVVNWKLNQLHDALDGSRFKWAMFLLNKYLFMQTRRQLFFVWEATTVSSVADKATGELEKNWNVHVSCANISYRIPIGLITSIKLVEENLRQENS
jgi:hypothetical protein